MTTLRVDVRRARTVLRCYGLWAVLTTGARLPSACPYRLVTGRSCPFCGLTRSVGRTLRGRPGGHPLAAVVVALLVGDLIEVVVRSRW